MFICIWIQLSIQQLRASFVSTRCYCMFGQLFYRVSIPMYVCRIRNQHKKGILYSYNYLDSSFVLLLYSRVVIACSASCFTESRYLCMYVGYAIRTKKEFFTPTTIDNLVLQSLDTYVGYDLSENTIYIEYMNVQIII
jgi:hypothetical protein